MTTPQTNAVDQAVCAAILDAMDGGIEAEVKVGSVIQIEVSSTDPIHGRTTAGKDEATVEQRHLGAVELFRASYGIRYDRGAHISFRIEPASTAPE